MTTITNTTSSTNPSDAGADSDDATIAAPAGPSTGGTTLDATFTVQSDGATQALRERVDIGFAAPGGDPRARLVGEDAPLPVESRTEIQLLAQIAEDVKMMRYLIERALTE